MIPSFLRWPAAAAVCFLLPIVIVSRGDEVVRLAEGTERIDLAPSLSIYRDASGNLTLAEARQAFRAGHFKVNRQPWPAFGFTHDAIWLRFAVHSACTNHLLWLIELPTARMDELDWYVVRENGLVEAMKAGNLRAASVGMVDYKFPVFPLRLNPDERAEVLLRVHSQTSIHVPLQMWAPGAFIAIEGRNGTLFSFFFGYIAALIVLSLILSVFTRNRGFVIYSLSLVWLFLTYFITSGYYAWLHLPATAVVVHGGVIATSELALLMMLLYLRNFFDLPATYPVLNRWVVRVAWLVTLLTALLLIGPFWLMNQLLLLQACVIGAGAMSMAGWSWWRGNRIARFYALAWVVFWLQFAVTSLQFLGWLPILTMPEMQMIVAITLSMTLFFMALADRVRQIRQDRDHSQAQLLQTEQQSARELRLQMQQQEQLIRDLHDGIGGLTANVGLLTEIGRREASEEQERGRFEHITLLAAEGSAEIHNLMSSLEEQDMRWADLIVECRRHGELMLPAHGLTFNLSVAGDTDHPGPGLFPGMSLFRVFKEALTNVVKHAGASQLDVGMAFTSSSFRLTVRDNGQGLGPEPGSGRGQRNMARRIEELGGAMTCRCEAGTELIFDLPLPLKSGTVGETAKIAQPDNPPLAGRS